MKMFSLFSLCLFVAAGSFHNQNLCGNFAARSLAYKMQDKMGEMSVDTAWLCWANNIGCVSRFQIYRQRVDHGVAIARIVAEAGGKSAQRLRKHKSHCGCNAMLLPQCGHTLTLFTSSEKKTLRSLKSIQPLPAKSL